MFIIFNIIGLFMALAGAIIAVMVARLAPDDLRGGAALALGVTWIAIDLGYRFSRGSRRFLHMGSGGHLFFIPIWCWGILCIYLSAGMLRDSIRERQESELHRQRIEQLHATHNRS